MGTELRWAFRGSVFQDRGCTGWISWIVFKNWIPKLVESLEAPGHPLGVAYSYHVLEVSLIGTPNLFHGPGAAGYHCHQ